MAASFVSFPAGSSNRDSSTSSVLSPPNSPRSLFTPVRKHRSTSPPPSGRGTPNPVQPQSHWRTSSSSSTASSALSPSHVHNLPPPPLYDAPIIKARLTPSATPRKKTLPGAERADVPPQVLGSSRPKSALGGVRLKPMPPPPLPSLQFTPAASPPPQTSNVRRLAAAYDQSADDSTFLSGLAGLGISSYSSPQVAATSPSKQDNVLVCVRVRPPAQKLAAAGAAGDEDYAWDTNPAYGKVALKNPLTVAAATSYTFDAVVQSTDNEVVYNQAGRNLVFSAMEGYDAVVFAYGQTASGKTFTLSGTKANPGIIPLSVQEIFSYIRDHPEREYLLRASYLEIYNETLRDLLSPASTTQEAPKIRQDANRQFFVHPLREEVVTGEAQVEALLKRGGENRSVGGTDFNEKSSRSHVVFQITIESRAEGSSPSPSANDSKVKGPNSPRLAGGGVRMSRLSLIDLAGSEGATSQSDRRTEGGFINKSLLTLEKVIKSLTESEGKKPQHVPYRDSKLTQILQPSLSGAARVSVIATLNPSHTAIEETKSTLKFAQRVKKVVLRAKVTEVVDDDKALITKYRDHILVLEQKLHEAMSTKEASATPSRNKRDSVVENLQRQVQDIQALFVNSRNVEDRRHSVLPPRPVSPIKLSAGTTEISYEDRYFDVLEKHAILQEENEDLQQRLLELTSSSSDETVAALMKENNELRVVVKNFGELEAGGETRKLERQLERCRHYESGLEANLAAERKRIAQFEKFILQHLSVQTEQITGRRRSSLAFSSPTQFHLPGLMNESPDLDAISPEFVELDDLQFSEENRKQVEEVVVRSNSMLRLPH